MRYTDRSSRVLVRTKVDDEKSVFTLRTICLCVMLAVKKPKRNSFFHRSAAMESFSSGLTRCTATPVVRNDEACPKTWQHLHQHGFPTPTSSKLLPSSYQTYLETISDNTCLSDSTRCPSFSSSDPILCDVCPFNRHNLICHMSSSRKRQNHIHLCGVEDCNLSFPTAYQLMKHKKSAGHQTKRGQPTTSRHD